MPNHCSNRVSFYGDSESDIQKLHEIFSKGLENDDDTETQAQYLVISFPNQTGSTIPLTERLHKSIHS